MIPSAGRYGRSFTSVRPVCEHLRFVLRYAVIYRSRPLLEQTLTLTHLQDLPLARVVRTSPRVYVQALQLSERPSRWPIAAHALLVTGTCPRHPALHR